MHISPKLTIFILLTLFFINAFATESLSKATPLSTPSKAITRVVVMPYKLVGDLGNAKIDSQHKQRLAMADATLYEELQKTKLYDLVDKPTSEEFSKKVTTALSNNDCQGCESTLAKEFKAKQIIVPWVYRLSQLVLTMHFVILDVDSGKTILKKSLDFRGDNDQSWQRAIHYFIENVKKP